MSGYDTALTVFSPNGHLFQVEYASEAVKRGLCSVGIVYNGGIVLAVEKKTQSKLQGNKTSRKIVHIDDNLSVAFAGLNADARILLNQAKVHCQSYRLNYDDIPTVQNVANYVSGVQQKHTQKGGVRPFGISTLIAGFDSDNQPRLIQTDPSGQSTEWKAAVIGRNQKQIMEYLEKNYDQNLTLENAVLLGCKALNEVVENSRTNIEICIVEWNKVRNVSDDDLEKVIQKIESEN